jgi:hypothetical protein
MGQRGLGASGLAPGLHHHHRLGVRGSAQRAHESAGVADALHVDQDRLGGAVVGQKVQRLWQVHRGVGAERDHGGKPHTVALRPIQDRRSQRARLRHQRQRPGRGQHADGTGVQGQGRTLEAQRVGAQQVQGMALGDRQQFGALRRGQAGGQHQRGAAANPAGHLQRGGDLGVGQGDDRQVSAGLGQIGQRTGHVDVEVTDWPGEGQARRRAFTSQAVQQGTGLRCPRL